MRTSGSIASGDLKLGLGRYGVISAFGRKEVENFSFTPSLTGTYNENIVVENVLDGFNDQNVAVKANVRKAPTFTVEPALVDFGSVTTAPLPSSLDKMGFTLTNVSKHERTFVVEIKASNPSSETLAGSADGEVDPRFADLSLSRDDVGTALSKTEEEEIENILQKLKIAKRKGKKDKITKYESRLAELGVQGSSTIADASDTEDGNDETASEATGKSVTGDDAQSTGHSGQAESETHDPPSGPQTPAVESHAPEYGPKHRVSTLTVVLQPNQKNRILVELIPKSPLTSSSPTSTINPTSITPSTTHCSSFEAVLQVHDKKNADESQTVKVVARHTDGTSSEMTSKSSSSNKAGTTSSPSNVPGQSPTTSSAALPTSHGELLSHAYLEMMPSLTCLQTYCIWHSCAIVSNSHINVLYPRLRSASAHVCSYPPPHLSILPYRHSSRRSTASLPTATAPAAAPAPNRPV